jgi:hypothetical protein
MVATEGGVQNVGVDRDGSGGIPKCKTPPITAVPLQHPAPQAELSLVTTASDTHRRRHAAEIFFTTYSQTTICFSCLLSWSLVTALYFTCTLRE